MTVLLTTIALFAAALALHLLLWRIRIPKLQIRALLILFGAMALAWLATLPLRPAPWPVALHILLFYGALSFCYVITYSAIEGDSPTLSLIRHLANRGSTGMSADEIRAFIDARPFVTARLRTLVRDGLVREERGRLFVASRGSTLFRLILAFRRLYGPINRGG